MNPTFSLYYPVKPWRITQKWGVFRPEVYSQFGFTKHNGVDVPLGEDKRVYAPFDGLTVKTGFQPNGGGTYIGFLSTETYRFPDGINPIYS